MSDGLREHAKATVWLLVGCVDYEGSDTLGVYASEEEGRAAFLRHIQEPTSYQRRCRGYHDSHALVPYEVGVDGGGAAEPIEFADVHVIRALSGGAKGDGT
jgi:hypothetical protein